MESKISKLCFLLLSGLTLLLYLLSSKQQCLSFEILFGRMNASMVDELLDALKTDILSQDANITGSIKILRDVDASVTGH